MAGCGLLFMFVMNSDIGLSVDWDLMSGFYLPAIVCTTFIWLQLSAEVQFKREVLIAVTCATAVHTLAFIYLNGSGNSAIARYEVLPDKKLWGKNAILGSIERLATYYDKQGDLQEVQKCYKRYIEIDSTNWRILSNVADLYQRLGDDKMMTVYLEKAIKSGAEEAYDYFVLAQAYRTQNRADEAYNLDIQGLALDSLSFEPNLDVGIYLARNRKKYADAAYYLARAAAIDRNSGVACYYTGLCYGLLGDTSARDVYWGRLFQLDSTSTYARDAKRILRAIKQLN